MKKKYNLHGYIWLFQWEYGCFSCYFQLVFNAFNTWITHRIVAIQTVEWTMNSLFQSHKIEQNKKYRNRKITCCNAKYCFIKVLFHLHTHPHIHNIHDQFPPTLHFFETIISQNLGKSYSFHTSVSTLFPTYPEGALTEWKVWENVLLKALRIKSTT